ncbi:MAG: DUF805 domain-containing protein [Chitinophagales bacterium]
MFKNIFSFKGRIGRLEYVLSVVIFLFMTIITSGVSTLEASDVAVGYLILLMFIPLLWILLAQGCKRCHDLNKNGFYQLIPIFILWMLFVKGTEGSNQYGNDPSTIDNNFQRSSIEEDLEREPRDRL